MRVAREAAPLLAHIVPGAAHRHIVTAEPPDEPQEPPEGDVPLSSTTLPELLPTRPRLGSGSSTASLDDFDRDELDRDETVQKASGQLGRPQSIAGRHGLEVPVVQAQLVTTPKPPAKRPDRSEAVEAQGNQTPDGAVQALAASGGLPRGD